MGIEGLNPSALLLLAGVAIDAILGDPQFRLHPIRLMGDTLSAFERMLRGCGLDGYVGGCLLLLLLSLTWVVAPSWIVVSILRWNANAGTAVHILIVYAFFALRDLIDHIRKVQNAANREDIVEARKAIGMLVGRDVDKMDIAACRRAAIESLSENFVDGVLSPVFWYVLLGIPGLLLFKVVSTMDSMVGYKTPKYIYFGWCGARLDDLMNYLPSRLSWLLIGVFRIPKGWEIGLAQHAVLPGPNPGWSEATMAGALDRRLIGPIWKEGHLVTDTWLGDPESPAAGSEQDVTNAIRIVMIASAVTVVIGMISIIGVWKR
ncbi:MAG TPA: adenosylcobinamide-phosphate synthase CbiB [Terriglobia bacterium]|nr:adenosylcobinamide-phosphate synthase CbiB [Terriglobia bacterium]